MKKILLITIGLSIVLFADFSRNNDSQIVIDDETSLQWQDNKDAKTIVKTWQNAIAYCEELTLGSYSDWRLPNINELISIVDDTKASPSMSPMFEHFASYRYWSSTTNASYSNHAWFVHFNDDNLGYYNKYGNGNVRCVRARQ